MIEYYENKIKRVDDTVKRVRKTTLYQWAISEKLLQKKARKLQDVPVLMLIEKRNIRKRKK